MTTLTMRPISKDVVPRYICYTMYTFARVRAYNITYINTLHNSSRSSLHGYCSLRKKLLKFTLFTKIYFI